MSTTLAALIEKFGGRLADGTQASATGAEHTVLGIGLDSTKIAPREIFAALPGTRTHGAEFAADTAAAAILTDAAGAEILQARDENRPVWVVENVRAVLGHIAAEIYGHPSEKMTVIGITGTSGKTTTSYILEAGLRAAGAKVGIIGTTGTRINGSKVPTSLTTPEAPKLQRLFAMMLEQGVTHVVMEVSSHALELGRVAGTNFAVAGFSNLSQDHLDFHPTMEDYFQAKARLFSGAQAAQKAAIVTDEHWGQQMAQIAEQHAASCWRVQTNLAEHSAASADGAAGAPRADVAVLAADLAASGTQKVQLRLADETVELDLPLPGSFNVANAALACALAKLADADLSAFLHGVENVAVPGRMESLAAGQDFVAVVDYAHKPGALEAVLATLRGQVTGRVGVVVGCGGDRDSSKREIMGRIAAQQADYVVVTDDNPRTEDPAPIRAAIMAGAREALQVAGRAPAEHVVEEGDRARAIELLVDWAQPGDAIVVAGKGHETGQIVGDTVHEFDDRTVLAAALEAAGYSAAGDSAVSGNGGNGGNGRADDAGETEAKR